MILLFQYANGIGHTITIQISNGMAIRFVVSGVN